MHPVAKRFSERFRGLGRAYGLSRVSKDVDARGKRGHKAKTLRGEVNNELWVQHLKGEVGLGITPIDDNNECVFGAIDIDVYPLDLENLELVIKEAKLPLTVCRTKSGGAHLYLFTKEPVPASLMRTKLQEWSILVGHPNVEVFPKQSEHLMDEEGGSFGCWINLPYLGGDRTTRYAVVDGDALSLEGFLDHADEIQVADSRALAGINGHLDPDLDGAPPCIQHLARAGVPEGARNQTLLAMGTYVKLKYGEAWEEKLEEFNQKYFDPPLRSTDVAMVVKGLKKKDYFYRCKEFPLASACNRSVCHRQKYGLRGSKDDPGITVDGLVKILTDPPMWFCNVNGKRLKIPSSAELMDQRKFERLCIDAHNIVPDRVKDHIWRDMIRGVMENVEEVPAPEDAGKEGQLMIMLYKFFAERNNADSISEVLLDKIYTDPDGQSYFMSAAFMAYCQRAKVNVDAQYVWSVLRDRGVKHQYVQVGQQQLLVWSMEKLQQPEIDFSKPKDVRSPDDDSAF
jgi:hypothetical protein